MNDHLDSFRSEWLAELSGNPPQKPSSSASVPKHKEISPVSEFSKSQILGVASLPINDFKDSNLKRKGTAQHTEAKKMKPKSENFLDMFLADLVGTAYLTECRVMLVNICMFE